VFPPAVFEEPMHSVGKDRLVRAGIAASVVTLAAVCTVAVPTLMAQTKPASPATSAASVKKPVHHKRKAAKPAPEPMAQAPVIPEEPPKPDWPVNDPSQPARVDWNGRQRTVNAKNASLSQVLHEVSSATGLKVEGLDPSRDQRIYGSFGPAAAHDVLSEILDGSGYNVILLGDRGEGNPRELLLSAQAKGAAQPSGNRPANQPNDEDAVVDEAPEPLPEQQPEPQRPQQGPPPPGIRPAQQYLQDLRNQQQQQQQQQFPPANPGQNPQQPN